MKLSIDAVSTMKNKPLCISIKDIKEFMQNNVHFLKQKQYFISGLQSNRNDIMHDISLCWMFRGKLKLAVMDVVIMKSKGIIIPAD